MSVTYSLCQNTCIDNLNWYGNGLFCSVNYAASSLCYVMNRLLTFFCFEHAVFVLSMCNKKKNFLEYKKVEWEPYVFYIRIDGVLYGEVCSVWRCAYILQCLWCLCVWTCQICNTLISVSTKYPAINIAALENENLLKKMQVCQKTLICVRNDKLVLLIPVAARSKA